MMECHKGTQAWQVNADGQKAEHNDSDHEWAKVLRAKGVATSVKQTLFCEAEEMGV